MTIVLLSVGIVMLIVAGMAVGVLCGREPIKGSCGGLNNVGVKGACDICGGESSRAPAPSATDLAYDAADPQRS